VSFQNPQIEAGGVRVDIGDGDLVLVPSAFIWPNVYLRDSPKRLALCYPAHGFGSLWERDSASTQPALARLLGGTHARLLRELERPSTVSELVARLGVTVSAVSQHRSTWACCARPGLPSVAGRGARWCHCAPDWASPSYGEAR
jgi:hypothetical protein